ncbi:MAG: hypothetical protein ACPGSG_11195 [Prolixibacteraceae bacterium]|jgi:hypothetical protein|nr:hypothetical protein [Prolixibacteraceae bacterium]
MKAFFKISGSCLLGVMLLFHALQALGDNQNQKSLSSIWSSVWDETVSDVAFKKVGNSDVKSYSIEELVQILNSTLFLDVEVIDQQTETIKVRVNRSEELTEHMGSSGARTCLGIITFTLTENPNVKKVDMEFECGSHASPGTYSRADFIQAF